MHHGQFFFFLFFFCFFFFVFFLGTGEEGSDERAGTSLCDLYFYDHASLSRFLFSIGGKNNNPLPPPPTHTHILSFSPSHLHSHTAFHIYRFTYNVRLNEIQPRVQNEKSHLFSLHNTNKSTACGCRRSGVGAFRKF